MHTILSLCTILHEPLSPPFIISGLLLLLPPFPFPSLPPSYILSFPFKCLQQQNRPSLTLSKTLILMANHHHTTLFLIVFFLSSSMLKCQSTITNQSQFFTLMNQTLSGSQLSEWDDQTKTKHFCNFTGISCNDKGYAIKIDIGGWLLSGTFPENVCSYLPELRILRLGNNKIHGKFPLGVDNCSRLEELDINHLFLTGTMPEFHRLKSLRLLDLSYNSFSGDFPMSITELTNLESLNLNENGNLNMWKLPESLSRLTKLKTLVLMTCMLNGNIPKWMGNMTSLVDLELGGNYLVGEIPSELGSLKKLKQLELYYNQLEGSIPDELGNLTELIDFDLSVNKLSGKIPESLSYLPNLRVLQLYNNSLSGEIPIGFANTTTLTMLSLYDNLLTGEVPPGLGSMSPMVVFDVSENQLSGKLPTQLCEGGKLQYFLVLENMFEGEIPERYSRCESLLRFRVSHNHLQGSVPGGILGLPHVSILDLGYNKFNGTIGETIGGAKNLSELFIENNSLSGPIPSEISRAANLVKIDLSNNLLSGPIPSEIGNLRKLNSLMLQGNKLSSSIPESLSYLKSLNILDLSDNLFTGDIPGSLSELLPNSMNFSHNQLSGPIPSDFIKGGLVESFSGNPGLCVPDFDSTAPHPSFPVCSHPYRYNRRKINCDWVIGISVGMIIIGIVLFLKRRFTKDRDMAGHDDALSSSFYSYDVKKFHRVSFDQCEIIQAMVEKNIVGHGGSGTVYRIGLTNGDVVAVKRLWSRRTKYSTAEDRVCLAKELKNEVETLGSIRHNNIVKLYCCFSSLDCSFLVYEYMPNGNLWDALHKGKAHLDWPIRHQIAIGIAQGVAYLHHDLLPPIIHRDIKSTNILLDVNHQPKVADFGIAKVLQARGRDSTTTVVAGTYGYLAPEYAYSSKATTKCDVYSFGVVLMELLTGKRPVVAEFGENKNIVYWATTKVVTKEGAMDVLDKRLSEMYKDEMIKALRVAIRCTCQTPALRPTMREVVQLLMEADPRKVESCKPYDL